LRACSSPGLAAGLCVLAAVSFAGPSPEETQPHPSASAPVVPSKVEGARRWDLPGAVFLLPDWKPHLTLLDKAMGSIALKRAGEKPASICLAWSYQAQPLALKDLGEFTPAYLGLLTRLAGVSSYDTVGENELEVIAGHAALKIKVHGKPGAGVEGVLVLWDCAMSHRTFGFFCHAPTRPITNQMAYAIGRYANCHLEPVDFGTQGPVKFQPPEGWKTVTLAPNQQVVSSGDGRSAIYLFMLALAESDKVTPTLTSNLAETLGQLVGRLLEKKEARVALDGSLGHDVGSIRVRLKIDDREADGVFEIWFCPKKLRLFGRLLLAPTAAEVDTHHPVLESTRCHE
jgi:hypothetical protein